MRLSTWISVMILLRRHVQLLYNCYSIQHCKCFATRRIMVLGCLVFISCIWLGLNGKTEPYIYVPLYASFCWLNVVMLNYTLKRPILTPTHICIEWTTYVYSIARIRKMVRSEAKPNRKLDKHLSIIKCGI